MQVPYRKPGKYTHLRNDPFITKEKFNEMERDLERLKSVVRPKLAAEVSRLAELGDFSENAEYQLAKGKLRGTNNAIIKLEVQLRDAQIIENKNKDFVELGSKVIVEVNGKRKTFQILGSTETNPEQGVISYSSPLGSALMNKEVGESVMVGEKKVEYKIIEIQ